MTSPTSQPRTASLYHAASGSAFSSLAALGITCAAWGTLLVIVIFGSLAGLITPVAIAVAQLSLIAVPIVAMRIAGRNPVALGIARPRWQHVVGAILIGVSTWYINSVLVTLLHVPQGGARVIQQRVEEMSLTVSLLVIAVLPAICEEILFRGVLLRGLASRFHAPVAIGISAAVFSIYHLNTVQMIPTFVLGLALGTIALRAGSALPTMVAHLLNNTVALLVTRGDLPAFAGRDDTGWLFRHPMIAFAGAAASTTAGLALAIAGPRAAVPGSTGTT